VVMQGKQRSLLRIQMQIWMQMQVQGQMASMIADAATAPVSVPTRWYCPAPPSAPPCRAPSPHWPPGDRHIHISVDLRPFDLVFHTACLQLSIRPSP
jgi:hypothetical protein